MKQNGLTAIGLFNPKDENNIGSVLRAARCYDTSMVIIEGRQFQGAPSDDQDAWKHIPIIYTADLMQVIPYGAVPVAIEFSDCAWPLPAYQHPESGFYIFGPEDGAVSAKILALCRDVIYVPACHGMNLATTVNVVLYDRMAKRSQQRG